MIRGLIEKKIRQHATLAVFITALMACGLSLFSSNKLLVKLGGSSFSLLSNLWFSMLPLVALVLGTGLVATEFRNKTQLFLEGLPMPRWMILVVKYLMGFGIISFCVVVLLTGAWWHGRNAEVMTVNFALLLLVKSLGWAWFCWSVCFAHGFLGRYRGWTGVMLVLGLMGLQFGAGVMVTQFGPFDLISDRFAYERFVWPVEALWVTFAMIVATTLAGFALGMVRDATVASMMAEKMSIREKVVLTVLTLTALLAALSIEEKAVSGKPLNLPGSVDYQQRAATVSAAAAVAVPTEQEELALNAHGMAVATMLEEVGVYLECQSLPPVYIIHRRDFDAEAIEEDEEQTTKCVLIRCNLLTTQTGDTKFQSRILASVQDAHQLGRLNSDTRGWVVKGSSAWWPVRKLAKTPADLIKLLGPEGKSSSRTLSRGDLETWLKTTEKMTPTEQSTCAALGMVALGDNGEEPRRRFLAAVLRYSAPMSARATLHDWLHPVDSTLRSTTGSDLAVLASKWTAAMQTGKAKQ